MDQDYENEPHLLPEEETATHCDFGGGIYRVDLLVPCSLGGVHQKSIFVLAGSMASALDVALESFGVEIEGDVIVVSTTRLDNTESRFLVPRSFLANAEESWIFKMRPRNADDDHMN